MGEALSNFKGKLHFFGNALDPVNGPLFGAVPFKESLLTDFLHIYQALC